MSAFRSGRAGSGRSAAITSSIMSRYNNGAAPVAIKLLPSGVIEAGADPFYNRSAHALVTLPLFDPPPYV